MSTPQNTTRDRLLDAAEERFAVNGYLGTSLRDITGQAAANLSAVKYHFGSKERLAEAIIQRCLQPLNAERLSLLEAEIDNAQAQGRHLQVEPLIRGFIEPVFRFVRSGPGGKRMVRIFGRLHTDTDNTIRKYFAREMLPVFRRYAEALKTVFPHLPPDIIVARLFLAVGCMGFGLRMMMGDLPVRDAGSDMPQPPLPDPDTLVKELTAFVIRGMEGAPCC